MKGIVDTHLHIWDLNRAEYPWLHGDDSILNNSWTIEQLKADRIEAGITEGILVQASGNLEDTELMLETANNTEWISAVVGWLPLMDPETTEQLLKERFLKEKYFKGVRHQVHDEADSKWLLQPAVIESLEILATYNLPFDIVAVLPDHIESALALANKVPDLKMVFDHLSQPPISTQQKFGRWGELMKEAAGHKNFYAKISGLGTASGNFIGRTTDDIKPYIAFALEHFEKERCFCGGDWPVSMLANNYVDTWNIYKTLLNELATDEEREKIFYLNAKGFYKI